MSTERTIQWAEYKKEDGLLTKLGLRKKKKTVEEIFVQVL